MLKINIIRGEKDSERVVEKIQFDEAKKTLDGDIMIFDHDLIDIVVSKEKLKVSLFPKDVLSEEVTLIQEKMLTKLAKRGVIDISTIRGGSIHSCLEGTILESAEETVSSFQVALLEIHRFLENEKINISSRKKFKKDLQDFFLDPTEEESTELGEVPHKEKKGSLDHQVRPYGYQYMYSILREITEK